MHVCELTPSVQLPCVHESASQSFMSLMLVLLQYIYNTLYMVIQEQLNTLYLFITFDCLIGIATGYHP